MFLAHKAILCKDLQDYFFFLQKEPVVKLSVTSKYNRLELQELAAAKERLFFT